MQNEIVSEVAKGLGCEKQTLPSKYYYDKKGDELFRQIMKLPEYYLTNCEYEILKNRGSEIISTAFSNSKAGNLVELGAGDGYKTKLLLHRIVKEKLNIRYVPVDISQNILDLLCDEVEQEIPLLQVNPVCADYFEAVKKASSEGVPNLILFLGSTVGNLREKEQEVFFSDLSESCNSGDTVLTGFDLQKDPDVILAAYNDKGGVTRAFNLNLISRLQKEVSADFKPEDFEHYPCYDPLTGLARSFLVPQVNKVLTLNNQKIQLEKGRAIHCETSRKYTIKQIEELAHRNNFEILKHYFDDKAYFVDSLWRKKD